MGTSILINKLNEFNWANNYINYINAKKRGTRKIAMAFLNKFILDFFNQIDKERRSFIDLVSQISYETNDYNTYLPVNLYRECFLNEISKWKKDDPNNPTPYKWSESFEDNKKALELDSLDQISLEKFSNSLINKISMNQHEIKAGFIYDGNTLEDILLINYFEPFIVNIKNSEKREIIKKNLSELKKTAIDYMSEHNK